MTVILTLAGILVLGRGAYVLMLAASVATIYSLHGIDTPNRANMQLVRGLGWLILAAATLYIAGSLN